MLSIHCLTGCDTVSFFFGQGKAIDFQIMIQQAHQFDAQQDFGAKDLQITWNYVQVLSKTCMILRNGFTRLVCLFVCLWD